MLWRGGVKWRDRLSVYLIVLNYINLYVTPVLL